MLSVRLLTVLVTLPLTAYGVSACFHHAREGRIAGFAFLVASASFLAHDMHSVSAELLFLLPCTGALVLLRDAASAGEPARNAWAGVLLGLGILLKYQAAFWLPALIVAAFLSNPRSACRRRVGPARARLRRPAAARLPRVRGAGRCSGLPLLEPRAQPDVCAPTPSPCPRPCCARHAISSRSSPSPRRCGWAGADRRREPAGRHLWRLASLLLCASFLSAMLGLRFYPHYFVPLYVPLALGAAPWLARQLQTPLGRGGRRARRVGRGRVPGLHGRERLALLRPRSRVRGDGPVLQPRGRPACGRTPASSAHRCSSGASRRRSTTTPIGPSRAAS